jgi:hypothetical protein
MVGQGLLFVLLVVDYFPLADADALPNARPFDGAAAEHGSQINHFWGYLMFFFKHHKIIFEALADKSQVLHERCLSFLHLLTGQVEFFNRFSNKRWIVNYFCKGLVNHFQVIFRFLRFLLLPLVIVLIYLEVVYLPVVLESPWIFNNYLPQALL